MANIFLLSKTILDWTPTYKIPSGLLGTVNLQKPNPFTLGAPLGKPLKFEITNHTRASLFKFIWFPSINRIFTIIFLRKCVKIICENRIKCWHCA